MLQIFEKKSKMRELSDVSTKWKRRLRRTLGPLLFTF